ncbi:glycosyltransferase [Microbacterium sp.]|uniref:glycosyltransferase family protein n=1 Tax=Microbacterium sp. TaxID=51671 RepID=UPI0039E253A8
MSDAHRGGRRLAAAAVRRVRRAAERSRARLSRSSRIRRGTLNWALKISSPADASAFRWGDTAFAADLAVALRARGQSVSIDHLGAPQRPDSHQDDVVLVLRGLHRIEPTAGAINYLWIISHPDAVGDEELALGWNRIFVASESWNRSAEVGATPLLQASSASRFSLRPEPTDIAEDVLFVGTSRGVVRPVVRDAIRVGAHLAVYGHDWDRFIDERFVRADHLDFASVPGAYRASRIVLNDHWEDMRAHGFLSNRLFDAAFVGARVISDRVDGIDRIFGGLVQTYDSPESLRRLLTEEAAWPSLTERRDLARRVRAVHSFDARAETLVDAAIADIRTRRNN